MTARTTAAMLVPVPALAPTDRSAPEVPGAVVLVPLVFPTIDPNGVQASFQLFNQSPDDETIVRSNSYMETSVGTDGVFGPGAWLALGISSRDSLQRCNS